ncbi:unnamed protein product [Sphenostylis stenocarpa]|uniref:Uncharacterized protein n=1 Tax=Sphenostylis stenocarpa TaxID=92480 RepID=A0AA86SRA2_9FABA|nr:unnamed protein product [Sphenostylis stenocarpa]
MAHDNKKRRVLPFSKGKLINCNTSLSASQQAPAFFAIKENSICVYNLHGPDSEEKMNTMKGVLEATKTQQRKKLTQSGTLPNGLNNLLEGLCSLVMHEWRHLRLISLSRMCLSAFFPGLLASITGKDVLLSQCLKSFLASYIENVLRERMWWDKTKVRDKEGTCCYINKKRLGLNK